MENDEQSVKKWGFKGNESITKASAITVRGVLNMIMENLNPKESRPIIPLGHGDPSAFPCFRTSPDAEIAVSDALFSAKYNGYSSTIGVLPARK